MRNLLVAVTLVGGIAACDPSFSLAGPWGSPVLTIRGGVDHGSSARVLLFDPNDPAFIHERTMADHVGSYKFEFDFLPPGICRSLVVALLPNGLQSGPLPLFPQTPQTCGGEVTAPRLTLPLGDPQILFWGRVMHAASGTLEFFSPADALTPAFTTFFWHQLWDLSHEAAGVSQDFRTSLGLGPASSIPEDLCRYTVRSRIFGQRTSDLQPIVSDTAATCSGTMGPVYITYP
jgi:hypothetical protein